MRGEFVCPEFVAVCVTRRALAKSDAVPAWLEGASLLAYFQVTLMISTSYECHGLQRRRKRGDNSVPAGKTGAKRPGLDKVFHWLVSKDLTGRDFFPILRCLSGMIFP